MPVSAANRWAHAGAPLRLATARAGVCVVEGFAGRVSVRHGRLHVVDGSGRDRRQREFSRVTPGFSRLVILGGSGSISLDAVRWLADLGMSLIHIDRDGRLLLSSAMESPDARLRRAQALALFNDTGVRVARELLGLKLEGQRQVLATLTAEHQALEGFDLVFCRLREAKTLGDLLIHEREAAGAYWVGWSGVEIRFRRSDQPQLPEHWRRFGQRSSPLTQAPRLAINPINALLNYCYALLEAETRLGLLTVGLDPGVGIVHADVKGRDSLALDVMEAVRPDVDRYLLELLAKRTFRVSDFHETRRGVCRVLAPLTHTLAKTAPDWGSLVAPVCENVAGILADAPGSRIDRLATPLTNNNRRDGRQTMRRHPATPSTRKPKVTPTCRDCGGPVPNPERALCDDCLPAYQAEQFERFDGSGLASIERAKAAGADPTHGGGAAKKRGAATARRKAEMAAWETQYGKLVDLSGFEREILPLIQAVPLSRLVKATGLSLRLLLADPPWRKDAAPSALGGLANDVTEAYIVFVPPHGMHRLSVARSRRLLLVGLAVFATMGLAACGGSAKHATPRAPNPPSSQASLPRGSLHGFLRGHRPEASRKPGERVRVAPDRGCFEACVLLRHDRTHARAEGVAVRLVRRGRWGLWVDRVSSRRESQPAIAGRERHGHPGLSGVHGRSGLPVLRER